MIATTPQTIKNIKAIIHLSVAICTWILCQMLLQATGKAVLTVFDNKLQPGFEMYNKLNLGGFLSPKTTQKNVWSVK